MNFLAWPRADVLHKRQYLSCLVVPVAAPPFNRGELC